MAETEADRVLLAKITGVARHLACRRRSRPEEVEEEAAVVDELRKIANGRADLLGELAGTSLGVGESRLDRDTYERIADLCVAAGADEELIEYWTNVGRYRAELARIPPSAGALRRP